MSASRLYLLARTINFRGERFTLRPVTRRKLTLRDHRKGTFSRG